MLCLEDSRQIVVVFAFCYEFAMQAAGFGDGLEQWEIHVEPVEAVALYILVNHLIIHFSIIGSVQIDVEAAILILVDVFQVRGIDENLTARIQQRLQALEEGREMFYLSGNSRSVHQKENRIETRSQMIVEES